MWCSCSRTYLSANNSVFTANFCKGLQTGKILLRIVVKREAEASECSIAIGALILFTFRHTTTKCRYSITLHFVTRNRAPPPPSGERYVSGHARSVPYAPLDTMLRRRRNRFRRTRLPFKRRYRFSRRIKRRFKSRNSWTGNIRLQLRASYTLTTPGAFIVAPSLNDFTELSAVFKNQFEAYRISKVTCKITPQCNTGWISREPQPGGKTDDTYANCAHYVSAPYHRATTSTTTLTPQNLLSLDRAREYSGFATSTRSFVPAVRTDVNIEGTANYSKVNWKPRLESTDPDVFNIKHYCAIYAFGGTPGISYNAYNITLRAHVTFYNQKTTLIN